MMIVVGPRVKRVSLVERARAYCAVFRKVRIAFQVEDICDRLIAIDLLLPYVQIAAVSAIEGCCEDIRSCNFGGTSEQRHA
jgi:hypothetical protein